MVNYDLQALVNVLSEIKESIDINNQKTNELIKELKNVADELDNVANSIDFIS